MKRIVFGLGVLVFTAAVIAGTTGAYFTDSETTGDNRFHAGTLSIDLAQDMQATLPVIVSNWAPGENATVEFDVINTGTLPVNLRTYHSGAWDFPGNPNTVKVLRVERFNDVNSTWIPIVENTSGVNSIVYYSPSGTESGLFEVAPGQRVHLRHAVLFDPAAGNEYQGRRFTSRVTVDAKQVTPGAVWPDSNTLTISCPSNAELSITRSQSGVVITWPTSAVGFALESSSTLSGPWNRVSATPTVVGECYVVAEAADQGALFYRLAQIETGVPVLTITNPVAEANLIAGRSYTINWSSQNIPASTRVAIQLKNVVTGVYSNQFTGIDNNGSVSWTVPNNLSGRYTLSINTCLTGNTVPCVSYEGPAVNITQGGTDTPTPPQGTPSLSITEPSGTIVRNASYVIRWTSQNIPATDRLAIQLKNVTTGNFLSQATGILNSGSFTWTVPETLSSGSYELHINTCVTGNVSPCITVKGPTLVVSAGAAPAAITVNEPAAGSTVARGNRVLTKWTLSGVAANESLTISIRNTATGAIAATLDGVPASFGATGINLTVPASTPVGTYQIVVSNCNGSNGATCVTGTSAAITIQ